MRLRTRYFILGALICVFLIIAPVTVIFALGLRYDFAAQRFVQTGTLMVRSQPKGAAILLNGKDTGQQTPATLRFLVPGEYDIKITKQGYLPWEKRLTVLGGQVTLASLDNEKITLFLDSPDTRIVDAKAKDFFFAGTSLTTMTPSSTIAFARQDTMNLITTSLPYNPGESWQAEYSKDGFWAVINKNGDLYAVSLEGLGKFDLSGLVPGALKAESLNRETLLVQNGKNELYLFDAISKKVALRNTSVSGFAADNGHILFVSSSSLYTEDSASTTPRIIAQNLPAAATASVIPTPSGQLFLILDGDLYLATAQAQMIQANVSSADWDQASAKLVLYNRNSVWTFDPQSGKKPDLIIRSESPIQFPQVNFATGDTFYLQNNVIKAVETASQISRNTFDLVTSADAILKFRISADGATIYYLDSKQGLLQTRIRQ